MVTTVTRNQFAIIDQISVFEVKRLCFVVTLKTEVIHLAISDFCEKNESVFYLPYPEISLRSHFENQGRFRCDTVGCVRRVFIFIECRQKHAVV